ncbi:FecCD family ABC transporter permease [Salibacterium aidingense]|uniref:FecCD family ABC transporter permease n=1 Tax=Salibacterium aidingense TaxID=384933 RepID=UPI0004260FD2|nr:iron ABC transporter permease [Salibacterium aidingense]
MILKSPKAKVAGLLIGMIVFVACILGSIIFGYTSITFSMVIDAYTQFDQSNEHLVIRNERMPRALTAAVIGASLAVAGAIMQALTRNPLASPGILGVNAGAGFFVVTAVSLFSITSMQHFIWIAFLGAATAAFIVYFLSSFGKEGLSPMKLVLAGSAMAALFSSFTQGLLVLNEQALDEVLFWLAGSVQGRDIEYLLYVLPYIGAAWILAMFIARPVNALAIGEDVAAGLGQKIGLTKLSCALLVIVLAGGSVAVAGPIGFIGIVIPNIVRPLVGLDHRWIFPYCAVLGGILLMAADVSARFIIMPQEVPVGVMTAVIGTPFFIYIARRGMSMK